MKEIKNMSFKIHKTEWGAIAFSEGGESSCLLLFDNTYNGTWDFPGGSAVKNLPANAGDLGLNPGQ